MRKAILIFACLLLVAANVSPQRKRPKPKTDPDAKYFDPLPEDEILFEDKDYLRLPGWRLVARGKEDSQKRVTYAYYDLYRIVRVKGKPVQDWVKYAEKRKGTEVGWTIAFVEYDCAGSRTRTLESTDYDKDGRPITSSSEASKWSRIIPDSLAEEFHAVICLNETDLEERDMKLAAKYFLLGRLDEKKSKNLASAYRWYQLALELVPDNEKVLAGIVRVKAHLEVR